jgi:hypothetical protein
MTFPCFQPSSGVVKFAVLGAKGVPGFWGGNADESKDCAGEGTLESEVSAVRVTGDVLLMPADFVIGLDICGEINDVLSVAEDAVSRTPKSISDRRIFKCMFAVDAVLI